MVVFVKVQTKSYIPSQVCNFISSHFINFSNENTYQFFHELSISFINIFLYPLMNPVVNGYTILPEFTTLLEGSVAIV